MKRNRTHGWLLGAAAAMLLAGTGMAGAHCDSIDGPVIIEAKAALDKGDITPVMKWLKPEGEAEVLAAWDHALNVRKLGPEARELADTYFFETLVRVHRAGENAPYTGLKPAGQQEKVVMAADRALETGSAKELIGEVTAAVKQGMEGRYQRAVELKRHANHNVDAGRKFVEAYVEFMHYVENVHAVAAAGGEHAHGEGETKKAATGGCSHP